MKIQFYPFTELIERSNAQPIPAIQTIPEWFKKLPQFTDEDKKIKIFENGTINSTVKWCSPFLDSLTAGYIVPLAHDIYVEKRNNYPYFVWRVGGDDLISIHSQSQISTKMIPEGYSNQPYKFKNEWGIKTPSGYSSFITHPVNRTDLPFLTFSGLVDTDTFNNPISFPFVIKDNFEGIIEKGTPIAQIIPVKRESWQQEIMKYSEEFVESKKINFLQKIYRSYKTQYWHRKDYK